MTTLVLVRNERSGSQLSLGTGRTVNSSPLNDILELLCAVCAVPFAVVDVRKDGPRIFGYGADLPVDRFDTIDDLSSTVIAASAPVQVSDMRLDHRFAAHDLVVVDPFLRAFAGVPIISADGTVVGTLLVFDRYVRSFDQLQEQALVISSRQIGGLLAQQLLPGSSADGVPSARLRRDLQRSRFENAIADLAWHALSDDLADLFVWVAQRVAQTLDIDYCRIVEFVPDADLWKLHAWFGANNGSDIPQFIPYADDPLTAFTLQSHIPIVVSDLAHEQRFDGRVLVEIQHVQSGACLLIENGKRLFGAISIFGCHRQSFARADILFLQTVADTLAEVIERTWRERTHEVVVTLSRTLRRASSRSEMLKFILDYLGKQLNSLGTAVVLRDTNDACIAAARGVWFGYQGRILRNTDEDSWQILEQSVLVRCNEHCTHPAFAATCPTPISGLVGMPLAMHGTSFGVLWVGSATPITTYEVHLIDMIADIAANAIYRVDLHDHTLQLYQEHALLSEEVRRAERHLVSIVESASDLVVATDEQGHIVTWNRAAERVSGYMREETIGCNLSELCVAEQQAEMRELLQSCGMGASLSLAEVDLLDRSGQAIPIAWRLSPIAGNQGVSAGVVAVGRDLTEHRQLQAQLFQSAKMASLGVMASGIGHELRNPLGIISANAQLAQEHLDNSAIVSTCVSQINTATKRAALITESLLTFASPGGFDTDKVIFVQSLKRPCW
jgi:PAS domain S-box-containing protein